MRYQIANLYYNAADGSLGLMGADDPETQLSLTANALLHFFLTHRGIVSREQVLKKVWDDNGLTASNNNLNQYLSLLRKLFRHYGITNIIITISRGNLQFNPEVFIAELDEASGLREKTLPRPEPSAGLSEETAPASSLEPEPVKYTAHQRGMCWYLAGIALCLIAVLLLGVILVGSPAFQVTPLKAQPVDECDLLVGDDMLNAVTHNNYARNFTAVLKRLNLRCKKGERFVFFYGDKLQTNGLGRVFLAHCAVKDGNDFSYCDNYFYYSWNAL